MKFKLTINPFQSYFTNSNLEKKNLCSLNLMRKKNYLYFCSFILLLLFFLIAIFDYQKFEKKKKKIYVILIIFIYSCTNGIHLLQF